VLPEPAAKSVLIPPLKKKYSGSRIVKAFHLAVARTGFFDLPLIVNLPALKKKTVIDEPLMRSPLT
jgi:hypothetical protein